MKKKRLLRYAAMLLGCLCLLLLGVSWATHAITELLERDTVAQLTQITKQTVFYVEERTRSDQLELEQLAAAIGAMGGPETPEVEAFLQTASWKDQGIRLTVSNAEGESYSSDGLNGSVRNEDLFRRAMRGEAVLSGVRPSALEPDRTRSIVQVVPIRQDGAIVGTLAASYDLQEYEDLVRLPLYMDNSRSCILQSDGALVVQSGQETTPQEAGSVDSFVSGEQLKREPELQQLWDDMAAGTSGYLAYQPQNGQAAYLCYAPLGINDWYLVNQISMQAIEHSKQDIRNVSNVVALITTAMLTLMLVALFISTERRIRLVERLALFDRLTNLPSRQQLQQRFTARPAQSKWVYLLLRIPDFGQISTVFGYPVGTQLLRDVAKVLDGAISPGETAARISEDHFALLLRGSEPQEETTRRIDALFERLRKVAVTDNHLVYDYHCSFLGGACLIGAADRDFAVVHRRASVVMDAQPKGIGAFWSWYDQQVEEQTALRDSLMPEIFRALKNDEFIPYFQPQIDLSTHEIVGAEVLARWQHPEHGILLPGLFVPLLEASGCVLELDLIMLEQACKMIQGWLSRGLLPVHLSVNISRLNIHRRDFFERLLAIVRAYDVPTNLLSLELTETAIFDNSEKVLELTGRLKKEGFILSMDDFGTGYSSLNMLREIPVDIIKLDQGFLLHSEADARGRKILNHIVAMVRSLGVGLIAEGVETEEQEAAVLEAGCTIVQGFYYHRPLAGKDFEQLIFSEDK